MSSPEDPNFINWALGLLSTITVTTIGWQHVDKRALRKQVEENTTKINTLESAMVTESRVRELLDEGLLPILKGITNIEKMLSQNTASLTALDKKFEIDKAVREERDRILKEIEDRSHE